LWTNQIVAISDCQFIVFDQSNNLFIFEKHPEPLYLEQKYKLNLIGSFCVNEEVKAAAFGSLSLARSQSELKKGLMQGKKLHYSLQ